MTALFLFLSACEGTLQELSWLDGGAPNQPLSIDSNGGPNHSSTDPYRTSQPTDAGTSAPKPQDAGAVTQPAPDAGKSTPGTGPTTPDAGTTSAEGCCGNGTCEAWCNAVGQFCNPQDPTNPGECSDSNRVCVRNNHTGYWQCALKCDPCNNQCPKGSGCVSSWVETFCWPKYPSVACTP